MTSGTEHHSHKLERLSAVMDGQADAAALETTCAAWREAEAERATWHAWHLIGDVMRSDDLASDATRDAAFLSAFRVKLADEAVVLAPSTVKPVERIEALQENGRLFATSAGQMRRRRRAWTASAAVAAGFVAVAGAVLVMQRPDAVPAPQLAQAQPVKVPQAVMPVAAERAPVPQSPPVVSGPMLRDAGIQQYLAAHKQFGGAPAMGVPPGYIRRANADKPAR